MQRNALPLTAPSHPRDAVHVILSSIAATTTAIQSAAYSSSECSHLLLTIVPPYF